MLKLFILFYLYMKRLTNLIFFQSFTCSCCCSSCCISNWFHRCNCFNLVVVVSLLPQVLILKPFRFHQYQLDRIILLIPRPSSLLVASCPLVVVLVEWLVMIVVGFLLWDSLLIIGDHLRCLLSCKLRTLALRFHRHHLCQLSWWYRRLSLELEDRGCFSHHLLCQIDSHRNLFQLDRLIHCMLEDHLLC